MTRLQTLPAFALIIALGLSLYNLAHPALFPPQSEPRTAAVAPMGAADVDLRPIIDLQPFGPVAASAQTPPESPSGATIHLQGIIMGLSRGESVAFLSVGDGRSLPYAAGDEAAPGIKVIQVDAGAVTLRIGTTERRIALPAYAQPGDSTGGALAPLPAGSAVPDVPDPPASSPQPLDPRNPSPKSATLTRGDTEFVENLVAPTTEGVYLIVPSSPTP
jgi:hypothetical protein